MGLGFAILLCLAHSVTHVSARCDFPRPISTALFQPSADRLKMLQTFNIVQLNFFPAEPYVKIL